jgi:sensor domain DACNV-containing protein
MKVQLSAGNDWQGWIGRIHDLYAHLRTIRPRNPPADSSMQPLGRYQLSQLIEFAFWASMKSDEERTTRVCITTADPADFFGGATALADQGACNEDEIAKLAPAVPQSGCIIISSLIPDVMPGASGMAAQIGGQCGHHLCPAARNRADRCPAISAVRGAQAARLTYCRGYSRRTRPLLWGHLEECDSCARPHPRSKYRLLRVSGAGESRAASSRAGARRHGLNRSGGNW